MYVFRLSVYVLLAIPPGAAAHEFWIEPSRFELAVASKLVADIRVGQYFKGNSGVFIPEKFVSFSLIDPGGARPVTGRLGDLPAVNMPTVREGLHVLAYHSTPESITYSDFGKFEDFAHKEGLDWVLDDHLRRGLAKTGITEAYTRYAKSLIQVGDGAGGDRALGMPLELVAETNPYTDASNTDIVVRLLWHGEGLPDGQISIFYKRESCKTVRTVLHTDAEGRAGIPRRDGGRFLLNSVHMIEPSAGTLQRVDAAWESLWASLTYELPLQEDPQRKNEDCVPRENPGK